MVDSNTGGKRILIVEDDDLAATTLARFLEKQGYAVEVEMRGDRAAARILSSQPDAVVLDGMLPGCDGLDVVREVRAKFRQPIVMLTARGEEMDEILGLELGADDYIAKPAEPRVVLARLRACMRRAGDGTPESRSDVLAFGQLSINRATRSVTLAGREIDFTTAEFDLLWLLAANAGRTLTRDAIFGELRGLEHDGLDRSIDMRISRLRRRLGDDGAAPKRIKTVRGKGYLFSPSDWE